MSGGEEHEDLGGGGRPAACVLSDGCGWFIFSSWVRYCSILHWRRIIPQNRSKVKDQSGKWGWFLVDRLGAGGLDDWEVKIADFVVLLGDY